MSWARRRERRIVSGSIGPVQALLTKHGPVNVLEITNAFRQHLADRASYRKHRVLIREIAEVHRGRPQYFPNTSRTGRAPLIMVGPTLVGRHLVVPLEPAGTYGIWRPVTAFEANQHHIHLYRGGLP